MNCPELILLTNSYIIEPTKNQKIMAKVDYYKFGVYEPYKFGGECYRTLGEAKRAYLKHLQQGHRLGCDIVGCTKQDDSIFLTFTPWYSDVKAFGRTALTNIGYAVKIGKYKLS